LAYFEVTRVQKQYVAFLHLKSVAPFLPFVYEYHLVNSKSNPLFVLVLMLLSYLLLTHYGSPLINYSQSLYEIGVLFDSTQKQALPNTLAPFEHRLIESNLYPV